MYSMGRRNNEGTGVDNSKGCLASIRFYKVQGTGTVGHMHELALMG